ncbi:Ionotropic receptor 40a, partial [Halyomorpha halys]
NLAKRNIIYFFYAGKKRLSNNFFSYLNEAMRICLVLNPRYGIFQVLYSQARVREKGFFLINWWSRQEGIFRSPLLPSAYDMYRNFHRRVFKIPVLHKPPWNFVTYYNDTFEVKGGRDDKVLKLLASKLNFRYEYFDPPDRSQGSAVVNGTMQGVLGLIWQRVADIFIGDLTVTYERSLAVDFSFLTLTDNEAFLTHAPGRLNEALALVRPFNWKVWPAVTATFLLAGGLVYLFFLAANDWKPHKRNLLYQCVWITTSIFLKQNTSANLKFDRVRFLVIILYLISTYVIGDMYSANLTSMLAKPAKEKPISNLEQLDTAMKSRGYQLLVEKHSASHTVLENGTGLYKSIWEKMKNQQTYLLNSTEEGMLMVRDKKNIAVIGGRETFFYNTKRFGIHHFHLSEKLFTRYSAIALQMGCPFIDNFNEILMQLFEAGILTKITEDEYQKLGELGATVSEKENTKDNNIERNHQKEDDKKLRTMSMKMLQGAFYVLLSGHTLAAFSFLSEIVFHCFNTRGAAQAFFLLKLSSWN